MRIVIMGNGIVANMGALYLRSLLPNSVEITVAGPEDRGGMPLVGESLIEISTRFLEEHLGLADYLTERHNPKFALTYYFKLRPDDPEDRRYSVHCNEAAPVDTRELPNWTGPMAHPPAWLLNRDVFDRDLKAMTAGRPGIERVDGLVGDVALDGEGGHTVTVRTPEGQERVLDATWVIDATGRRRVLGKRLGLIRKPTTGQRSSFWFRLSGYDRNKLKELEALGPMPPAEGEPYHYDRYYSTHHFMGNGFWIWLIPLRDDDGSDLMSVGFTFRPDVFEGDVRCMDSFMEHTERTHPVVADLVRSGTPEPGATVLRNYHYTLERAYSADRWCIVGDAAFAPDPLFSNGLAFSCVQLEQVGAMIRQDVEAALDPAYVEALDRAFWAPVLASQEAITRWYESMDDAFLCSLRLNWIEVAYFYVLLPLVVNGCHHDRERLVLWRVLEMSDQPFTLPGRLLDARAMFDEPEPEHFIYRGKVKVNPRALEVAADYRAIREQMAEGGRLRDQYARDVLARLASLGIHAA